MNEGGPRVLLFVVWLIIFSCHSSNSACIRAVDKSSYPSAPYLQMSIAEYPDDEVIPAGYNVTIVCTSNISLVDRISNRYLQIYRMLMFFYDNRIAAYGGAEVDREDSKTCKFVIQNSKKKDSGLYYCTAYNEVRCTEASLNVTFQEPSAPHFTTHPRHKLNIPAGQSANLSCEASGVPRPAISWFKDGRPLSRARINEEKGFSMLMFDSASPRDHGQYWCDARSVEGENSSSAANVTVSFKPVFSVHPANISTHENANVTLTCEANGFPPPLIGWLKNEMPVLNATLAQNGTFSSLVLHFVQEEKETGKYRCLAKNSQGQAISTEGTLTISNQLGSLSALSFYHHPESIEASRDTSVRFTCSARGLKIPVITWLKDGKAVTDSNTETSQTKGTSALRIWSVHQRHVGQYWCVATTSGWNATSRKATLSLKEPKDSIEVTWLYLGAAVVVLLVLLIGLIGFTRKRWAAPSYRPNQQMVNVNQKQLELNFYTKA